MSTWHGGFQNRGTPKSSNFIGISIINHPFWGIPIFGNTHMMMSDVKGRCPHGRFPHIAPPPYAWVHTCRHHSDRAKRIQKVTSNLTKSPPSFSEFHDEFHIGLRCWPFQQGFFTWQIMDIHVSSGLWCLCDVTISCPLSSTCKEQTGLEDLQELNNQNWKVHQATALQIWKLRMKENTMIKENVLTISHIVSLILSHIVSRFWRLIQWLVSSDLHLLCISKAPHRKSKCIHSRKTNYLCIKAALHNPFAIYWKILPNLKRVWVQQSLSS